MNKGELVDLVAEKTCVTKKQADSILVALLESIVETVSSGEGEWKNTGESLKTRTVL